MSGLIKRLKEERIQGSSAVLNYSNFDYWVNWDDIVDIVEDHDQPQLNENQQIVLKHLKSMSKLGVSAMVTVYCLVDDNINDNWQEYSEEIPEHIEALQKLSVVEENQVLQAFSQWALEQEEE